MHSVFAILPLWGLLLLLPTQAQTTAVALPTATEELSQNLANPAEFARYPATASWHGKPAAPILDTPLKRRFRSVLRAASQQAPDLNGHYRLVRWGCGMNCLSWAVLNQRTGEVWIGDQAANSCWAYDRQEEDDAVSVPDWLQHSVQSQMFYAYVCDDLSGRLIFNQRKVYLFRQGKPHLLRIDKVRF